MHKAKLSRSLYLFIGFAMFLAITLFSCKEPKDQPDQYVNTPIAGFGWTGNDGPAPVTVAFSNSSENADKFEWDFGDGYSSTDHSPQHTYHNTGPEPKNYLVILKATDTYSGLFNRRSKVIVIQPGG